MKQSALLLLLLFASALFVTSTNVGKRGYSSKRLRHTIRDTIEPSVAARFRSLPLTQLLETETCLSAPSTQPPIVDIKFDHPDYPQPEPEPPGTPQGILPIPVRKAVRVINGTTCCNGLSCPYAGGICCPYSTHCCPAQTMCVHDSEPPMCDDGITIKHKKVVRIVQVDLEAEPIVAATMTPAPASGADVAPPAPTDTTPSKIVSSSNYDQELETLIDFLKNPEPKKEPSVVVNSYLVGKSWPPMAAYAPDGSGNETFIYYDQRDWTGIGLIRNGTYNIVKGQGDCEKQCASMPECRVYKFVRTSGQCWLDTELASTARECPLDNGRSDCVSSVKRAKRKDMFNPYGPTTTNPADWIYRNQTNYDLGFNRLLRNGRNNILSHPSVCLEQCSKLQYCKVAVYLRPTKECWLSTQVFEQGKPCASRGGVRDCVSFVKMPLVPDGIRPATKAIQASAPPASDFTQVVDHNGEGNKAFNINIQVGQNQNQNK